MANITDAHSLEILENTTTDDYRTYNDGQSGNITVTVSSSSSWVSSSTFYGPKGCLTTVNKNGLYFIKATLRWTDTHDTVSSSNIAIYGTSDNNSTSAIVALMAYSCSYTNSTYIGELSTVRHCTAGDKYYVSWSGNMSTYTYGVALYIIPIFYITT